MGADTGIRGALNNFMGHITGFFDQKFAQMDSSQSSVDALANKLIFLGTAAVVIIIAIVVLYTLLKFYKASRQHKQKREIKKTHDRLKREEERLREERMYYEEMNRQQAQAPAGDRYDSSEDDAFFAQFDNFDNPTEYPYEWTPDKKSKRRKKGLFGSGDSKATRQKASRTTQFYADVSDEYKDAVSHSGYNEWDDDGKWY